MQNDFLENKFSKLITEGKQLHSAGGWDGYNYYTFPPSLDYQRFCTQALNLIERVCGRNSVHFESLNMIMTSERTSLNSFYLQDCIGILEGAFNDFKDGMLLNLRNLIRADLVNDFLEQAEILFTSKYIVAAASITGAVLEDTLRKLCDMNQISYPEKTSINFLNTELAKANVYDKLIQKEITAKSDLRNSADHGLFDKVREPDVEDMIRWVRRFVSEYLR